MRTGVSFPIEVIVIEDEAGDILLMKQSLAREPIPMSIHVAVDGKQAVDISNVASSNRMWSSWI